MLSKFIEPGDRIEMQAVERNKEGEQGTATKVYKTQVYEIQSEDRLELNMPMEKTKLVLLPVDMEYDLVFYGKSGLFQCFARIVDRYKSNNVYILVMEITSNLRKYQRREYYRYQCALEMSARPLEEEEHKAVEENRPFVIQPGLPLKSGVIVDISGGGLRFMSVQLYEPESLLYCSFHLIRNGERKKIEVTGKVLSVKGLENRPGTFEHRVKFTNMDVDTREEIIKYIFEEERKSRKKERLGT